MNISIASHTDSIPAFTKEYIPNKNIHIPIASHTGSTPLLSTLRDDPYRVNIEVSSATGSIPSLSTLRDINKDMNISIASHTGSTPTFTEEYIPSKNVHIPIASNTGSIPLLSTFRDDPYRVNIEVSSATGSIPTFTKEYIRDKSTHIVVSSHTGSVPSLSTLRNDPYESHVTIASHTGSVPSLSTLQDNQSDYALSIASHTGSVPSVSSLLVYNNNSSLDVSLGYKIYNDTGSLILDTVIKPINDMDIIISTPTYSRPIFNLSVIKTIDGVFDFLGEETLKDKLDKGYSDLSDNWGTSSNDVHFIHFDTGSLGKYNDYNTYHYENRYIFNIIGDVETLSGSYPNLTSAFETDFTGTVTAGIFTASKDFSNKTVVRSDISSDLIPLGTTSEFLPTGSISFGGGKFLDETFVYPNNHQFMIGTSKDSIEELIYNGTQNTGGEILESYEFTDLSPDAFYVINTTGGSGYTIQYNT